MRASRTDTESDQGARREELTETSERPPVWRMWASRLAPWASLAASITGAIVMDRSERRGALIAAGAAASWFVMLIAELAYREPEAGTTPSRLRKLARYGSAVAGQSLVQLSLFFSGPFYLAACSWSTPQLVFLGAFAVAAAISLWDPLCERVLRHPIGGPALNGFASFVGFNAAFPMLGLANRYSVWAAAGAVALMVALRTYRSILRRASSWAAAAGIAAALASGAIRALPPAPLRLLDVGIGTHVEQRKLLGRAPRIAPAPGRLICFSAIRAPLGLHEQLVHEWRFNGKAVSRVQVNVRGGRRGGYRTWTRQRVSRRRSRGRWRCEVLTSLGQSLGAATVELATPPTETASERNRQTRG